MSEISSFTASAKMVADLHMPDIPLTVISRGRRAWPDGPEGDMREAEWQRLQNDLVTQSSRGRHVIARLSDHGIPAEEPQLIETEILTMARGIARGIPAAVP
jgi:hypothetical protein